MEVVSVACECRIPARNHLVDSMCQAVMRTHPAQRQSQFLGASNMDIHQRGPPPSSQFWLFSMRSKLSALVDAPFQSLTKMNKPSSIIINHQLIDHGSSSTYINLHHPTSTYELIMNLWYLGSSQTDAGYEVTPKSPRPTAKWSVSWRRSFLQRWPRTVEVETLRITVSRLV